MDRMRCSNHVAGARWLQRLSHTGRGGVVSEEREAHQRLVRLCRLIWGSVLLAVILVTATPILVAARVAVGSMARVEMFASAGITRPTTFGFSQHATDWPRVQLGAGYRISPSVSVGVDASLEYLGTFGVTYFPPGDDFQSATESMTMVPVRGYLTLRLPSMNRARPYVSVQGGSYRFLTHSAEVRAPDFSRTRPGVGAAFGISGNEGAFAPRLELAYEARSSADDEFGGPMPKRWLQMFTVSVGLRAQR